ncbi:hypothetical protein K353_01208 [Kitasatospora sp. SolWspMP-SS2h]|uniref:hypothetical protein n=1 Tax=Kitasatospora sp. SolWspMP-SS2h TaxID=1305729 RepID=UPI000DBA587B|nr:hypothetical protein [Kitasatospora sp. SolWspMP-SS2h]RAJ44632.1 hypothetical protein K353_01208 [Kitasatospora sp. SolWspMP-SS2h]
MHADLTKARELLDAGDPQGAVRELRSAADGLSAAELAPAVRQLADLVGIDDLAGAAAELAADPSGPAALYAYGYACIEHGLSEFAVPALRQALRGARQAAAEPEAKAAKRRLFGRSRPAGPAVNPRQVLLELAVALEDGERHHEAVELLREHRDVTGDWPDRYLLVHNALMAGDLDLAREVFGQLSAPDETWRPAADRIGRTLARAAAVPPAGPADLRGWHHVLTGGLLATLSPYGHDAGMTGRWAYLQGGWDDCRLGLERLRVVLDATGRRPAAVALLPDRGSRALGLAAAELLGLPAAPYRPGTPDTLVVAYDLNELDGEVLSALHERAPGELLYEHATCWTDTPAVSADVCGLLVQRIVAPWEPRTAVDEDGEVTSSPADERPAEELAREILAASAEPDPGDGATPPDPDAALAGFAARAAATWATGSRDRIRSAGPVRSSRFA